MTWTAIEDREMALRRLKDACEISRTRMDREEIEALEEIIRLIEERVPSCFFKGLGDFTGPTE